MSDDAAKIRIAWEMSNVAERMAAGQALSALDYSIMNESRRFIDEMSDETTGANKSLLIGQMMVQGEQRRDMFAMYVAVAEMQCPALETKEMRRALVGCGVTAEKIERAKAGMQKQLDAADGEPKPRVKLEIVRPNN